MKKLLFLLCIMAWSTTFAVAQSKTNAKSPAKSKDVTVVQIPESTAGADILNTILKPYKGQVVVIDVWATWCGPCMQAMKQIAPIKEQYLKDKKKVAFVYVTGETSPLANFNSTIPSIKGYHYRLTNAQFKALLTPFGIKGIPTYIIFNKDGSKAYDNAATGGYPGDDTIIAEIDKALAK